jgi:hypothetical protein
MRESRLISGVRRALAAIGAVFAVAVLCAGEATADGPVQLRSQLGDLCLDATNGAIFAPSLINPCNGSDSQRWNLNGAGQLESVAFPGSCLTTPGQSWWVHLQPCGDFYTEHWSIQPNGQVTATFGGCLTVLGGADPGTQVSTRACVGNAPDQAWDSAP